MSHPSKITLGIVTLLMVAGANNLLYGDTPNLHIERDGDAYSVQVLLDGKTVVTSPPEGLWSIASDWQDGWPTGWVHAAPTNVEQAGDWTILHGELSTPAGAWQLRDAYRTEGDVIRCVRRFTWQGSETAQHTTLSIRFQCPGKGSGALLPGILYYGNPSGRKSGRVPVYSGAPGEAAFFEEHRFPMPYACLEWDEPTGRQGTALHSLPSPVPFGNRTDQWWSLGLAARENGTELALLSGPCASNGKRSVIKATQRGFISYDNAWLDVSPGAIIEKTFFLEAYDVATEGSGFQQPTRTSLALFSPCSTEGMPTFREIVQAKYDFAQTRWHETETMAGFKK